MKILTNCVSKKTQPTKISITDIEEPTIELTFQEWKKQTQSGTTKCIDLYSGRQWDMIKNISKTNDVHILSAGYGLINLNTLMLPYEITFSSAYQTNKHLLIPNFGLKQQEVNKKWFNMFENNFNFDTDETIIVTLNDDYLKVLDIPKKDNIIVISKYKLGRLAKWLGTGANDLKVKFTEYLTINHPNLTGNKELKQIIKDLDNKYGEDLYKKRQKVSNEFILDLMKQGWDLKKIRENDYKCSVEKFREFKKLYF